GAARDRGKRETAATVTDHARCRIEEIAARAGGKAQMRHQQKEGQHAELVAQDGFEQHDARLDDRGFRAEQHDEPHHSDETHRNADRNAERQQDQQCDDAERAAHRRSPVRSNSSRTKSTAIAAAAMNEITRSGRNGMLSSSLCSNSLHVSTVSQSAPAASPAKNKIDKNADRRFSTPRVRTPTRSMRSVTRACACLIVVDTIAAVAASGIAA